MAIASRSEEKLIKVEHELRSINPNIKTKVIPIDLAHTSDYSPITSDPELSSNLGVVVNNAGQLLPGSFFSLDPSKLQSELKLNTVAITLLTKYARNAFMSQTNNQRFALVQLSSSVSEAYMPNMSQYSATKRYDDIFAQMID